MRVVADNHQRLLQPQACIAPGAGDAAPVLTPEQVTSWQESGYVLVDGVFPAALLDDLQQTALASFPAPGTQAAAAVADFGSNGGFVFPSTSDAFNAVTLHPRLLMAIAQLLAVPVCELRLTQSDLWAKYGHRRDRSKTPGRLAYDNQDQRIHVDYPNHMLAHPAPWDRPEAVEAILYLSDFPDCGGPTAVVPRRGSDDPCYPWPIVDTPGVGELQYINDRESAEAYLHEVRPGVDDFRKALYEREHYAAYRKGTLLLYRHDTWHRGTPLVPGALRLAQNLTFRRADCEWISTLHIGWAWGLYERNQTLARLIAAASLDQRAVLGFPQPGAHYWCEQTIAAVEARYGAFGIDMAPYRGALAAQSE